MASEKVCKNDGHPKSNHTDRFRAIFNPTVNSSIFKNDRIVCDHFEPEE